MTESEFTQLADAVFKHIEQTLDASECDVESHQNDAVLELEFADGAKIILNRHLPNQEIWVAARSGGFHYRYHDGKWLSQRDGSELFARLGELIQTGSGVPLKF